MNNIHTGDISRYILLMTYDMGYILTSYSITLFISRLVTWSVKSTGELFQIKLRFWETYLEFTQMLINLIIAYTLEKTVLSMWFGNE